MFKMWKWKETDAKEIDDGYSSSSYENLNISNSS